MMPTGDFLIVEIDGKESLKDLYEKVADALHTDAFELSFEEEVVQGQAGIRVDDTGLSEGSEVTLLMGDELCVKLSELQKNDVKRKILKAAGKNPDLVLAVDISGVQGELFLTEIPRFVKHLAVVCYQPWDTHITRVGYGFLKSQRLHTLDLRGLSIVTEIGDCFLDRITLLNSVDLRPLRNVTTIGPHFLDYARIPTIDLTPLSRLKKCGDNFLRGTAVKKVTWEEPCQLTDIPHFCFYECEVLESVDLRGFQNATRMGWYFLSGCDALRTVDLRPLSNLVEIGIKILVDTPLPTVDLTPLASVVAEGSTELFERVGVEGLNKCGEVRVLAGSYLSKLVRRVTVREETPP
eukprot:TRINITY_DN23748_c0_g1_i1.p1 TRINITY_DN23748_c0_g1~~TRINITY_DN23748_c0_g1_i1.p1  ORF type:complete len:351 (+),score=93.85 TRINITY_DN23748_c0_g1_i1:73-1125(+)